MTVADCYLLNSPLFCYLCCTKFTRKMRRFLQLALCVAILAASSTEYQTFAAGKGDPKTIRLFQTVSDSITSYLKISTTVDSKTRIERAVPSGEKLKLYFDKNLKDYPLRKEVITAILSIIDGLMPSPYTKYEGKVILFADDINVNLLESRFYSGKESDNLVGDHLKKVAQARENLVPLITNESRPYTITAGLQNRHLAIWQSHGRFYDQTSLMWKWQRSRFFETVEDLFTQSYVLPYLVPMLENAGAVVLLPRERDFQKNEAIVDNDSGNGFYSETGPWADSGKPGFALPTTAYITTENPFNMGLARMCSTSETETASVRWTPDIPEAGRYGVYVSYQTVSNSAPDARYTVFHKGGRTTFKINQQMGGGTWIFLGYFDFDKGLAPDQYVLLTNESAQPGTIVSADAIRFGGGMGNIARRPDKPAYRVEPEVSGDPRFAEGARYYLQWAGFVDSVYTHTEGESDYRDDIWARCHWVNALTGGSYVNPSADGYNIPLDLCLGLHSDAGFSLTDSIVGTLAIYTPKSADGRKEFLNGESRISSREFADIVQTSVVNDIRAQYEPLWSRRELWSRNYAESREPEIPSLLLEMLSHQNLADMRYGIDPSFQFTVSRAIYKGILKFLSYLNGFDYVVQPLPIRNISSELERKNDKLVAKLEWKPALDSLEQGAVPDSYVLYTRIDGKAFDGGRMTNDCSAIIPLEPGHIYSFRVTAVNAGGESFPSETISVGAVSSSAPTALIVNNFDRISAPVSFASPDSTIGGFADNLDSGVPYMRNVAYVGAQHDFRRSSIWLNDDNPGFGASDSNYETMLVAGNTFDYPFVHGKALMAAGYSFVSQSREALCENEIPASKYEMLDLICGKQKTTVVGREGSNPAKYTVFTPEIQEKIAKYATSGGNILISGSYVASDNGIQSAVKFAYRVLKYKTLTGNASATGIAKGTQNPLGFKFSGKLSFRTRPNEKCYSVESPDALTPVGKSTHVILRYDDSNTAAGIAYNGADYKAVTFGFPIEVLEDDSQILEVMKQVTGFFGKK